ncbi:mannonate dehydratase [Jannaschia sp. W003]|uniref:mannonate dehydratase n=1 Tax=Jannaschia sp. W003 TaxID=2867012 RepID=UPI0021A63556|nr:mannonate dehydratase [Jannaschia sp. W003]UWQ22117.1 mannonate dehydratase [Jannaschia sp. W003]
MIECWRWFGPNDAVTLGDVRQTGATGIVTALHHVAPGQPWERSEVAARRRMIEEAGLRWEVVESLPVSEAVKTAAPEREAHLDAYRRSLAALAAEGIRTVCYNFMPVLDWTRTDLGWPRPSGATALRFDLADFAAWDRQVLGRASDDYADAVAEEADRRAAGWTDADRARLTETILAGLPGSEEHWTPETFRGALARYEGIDAGALRANLRAFLDAVVPEAERLGIALCAHPDDPPWPLFGLPRILSTEEDYRALVAAHPSPSNGITFCTGSLGARGDVDLPGMATRLGPHVRFAHLRNVRREDDTVPGSFFEDDHLGGSTDMVAVVRALLAEEGRRAAGGHGGAIHMRPDHGQRLLTDHGARSAPGYPAVGRLRGLAELRGVMAALR